MNTDRITVMAKKITKAGKTLEDYLSEAEYSLSVAEFWVEYYKKLIKKRDRNGKEI